MKYILTLTLLISFIMTHNTSVAQSNNTDYSISSNWSKICDNPTKKIDVLFIHPTSYGSPSHGRYNADLNDSVLNNITDNEVINRFIRLFEDDCNVFAPRYQQANIEVLSMSDDETEQYFTIAQNDVLAALTYYLENLNNGRPFILAGHSQGSNLLHNIIVENPQIIDRNKLVAAYLPGWTFTTDFLEKTSFKLCSTADETGCLITWNTIGENGTSPTLHPGGLCVNPLSWNSEQTEYSASNNKGALIQLKSGEEISVNNFTSAKINDYGGLQIPTPEKIYNDLNLSMGPDCYHHYDYDFFFNNVKENVHQRCISYLRKQ